MASERYLHRAILLTKETPATVGVTKPFDRLHLSPASRTIAHKARSWAQQLAACEAFTPLYITLCLTLFPKIT